MATFFENEDEAAADIVSRDREIVAAGLQERRVVAPMGFRAQRQVAESGRVLSTRWPNTRILTCERGNFCSI